MITRAIFGMLIVAIASPASAGFPVPTPEAGAGFASLAIVGAAYAWLRKRTNRR